PNEEMAFLFGKEQYSRRFACTGMWVAETRHVMVTPYTDEAVSVYDVIRIASENAMENGEKTAEAYEIFHLKKRGKAHTHVGTVTATSYEGALAEAKKQFGEMKPVVNIWRSEEHTSELQSRENLVCRLLLEKKKKKTT